MGTDQTPAEWLSNNALLWPLVLPVDATNTILTMKPKQPWKTVHTELKQIIDSSMLGCRIFSFATRDLAEGSVVEECNRACKELMAKKSITEQEIMSLTTSTVERLQEVAGIDSLPSRRTVTVQYRGWAAQAPVKCLGEQVELSLRAAARGAAVRSGLLQALPGEASLCTADAEKARPEVTIEVYRHAASARRFLASMLTNAECKDGEFIMVPYASTISHPMFYMSPLVCWPWVHNISQHSIATLTSNSYLYCTIMQHYGTVYCSIV
jgi:hypothetical protein